MEGLEKNKSFQPLSKLEDLFFGIIADKTGQILPVFATIKKKIEYETNENKNNQVGRNLVVLFIGYHLHPSF